MEERAMLLELKRTMQQQLRQLEEEIIMCDLYGDDELFAFLLKKAAYYRDVLLKIDQRLAEL